MQLDTKNIENLVHKSLSLDATGKDYYKDVFTLPIQEFDYTTRPLAYKITENDVYRFDLLIITYYGQVDYYLDMVLWLNKIEYLTDDWIGVNLYFPTKADMDSFYKLNYVGNA